MLEDVQAEASPPDVKLRKLVLAFVHVILDELQGTALTLDLQALSPPLLRKVIARRDVFDRGVRAIIQQGMDEGLFATGDPKMVTFAVMGAVNWITRWYDPAGPMSSHEIGTAFADYLVGGLSRPSPPTPAPERPRYSAVWPGLSSSTSIPDPASISFNCAGVPVSSGNVPQCIGTTCFTPSQRAAIAAVSGPIVKRSPIGRNAMSAGTARR